MSEYLVSVQAEVLYEKANNILAKYEKYLNEASETLDVIEELYKNFCVYTKKIILCSDEIDYKRMERNVNEYDRIIDNVYSVTAVGA